MRVVAVAVAACLLKIFVGLFTVTRVYYRLGSKVRYSENPNLRLSKLQQTKPHNTE